MTSVDKIRNLAIIAHIDHGKTTLIDAIFRSAHVFRESARVEERVMDSNPLERERGITIRSKHCTVEWGGYLINIIDTPGHADFSGEVERVLSMVDSVLLLVDANEGPMPQTRYVLMRALRLGLRPIVVVNKADRPNADPSGALDSTFDLFVELGADDDQLDFPVLYGSGLEGWLVTNLDDYTAEEHEREAHGGGITAATRRRLAAAGMSDLFETIIASVPPPQVEEDEPFLMQVSTLAWSDYIGRIGCGRVLQGTHRLGDELLRTSTVRELPVGDDAGGRCRLRSGRRGGTRRAGLRGERGGGAVRRRRHARRRLAHRGHRDGALDAPLGHARPRAPRGRASGGRRHRLAQPGPQTSPSATRSRRPSSPAALCRRSRSKSPP